MTSWNRVAATSTRLLLIAALVAFVAQVSPGTVATKDPQSHPGVAFAAPATSAPRVAAGLGGVAAAPITDARFRIDHTVDAATLAPDGVEVPAALVDDDVWQAAHAGRRVSVVVALRPNARADAASVNADADATLADRQQHVLSSLPTGSFRLTHRYVRIAALGGRASTVALRALEASPHVVAVSLDPPIELDLADAAAYVGADRLRRSGVRGAGVGIAVLDTGVDTGNIDLRDAIVAEACFLTPASLCPDPPHVAEDVDGHGTSVSAIALSRGKRSDHGIASEADLIAVKLIEERNNAAGTALLAALDWVLGRDDVQVVNMSFSSGAYEGICDTANAYTRSIANAVRSMHAKHIVPVAASGNDGSPTKMGAPACLSGVISVGATQGQEPGGEPQLAPFTNRNETLDVLAPGVGIATTTLAGRDTVFGGTSAAAPIVAGAVALLVGEVPWATYDQIVDALKSTAGRPTLRYGDISIGTIRVDKALTELRKIEVTDTPSPTVTQTASRTTVPPTATRTAPPPTATSTITETAPPSPTAAASHTASIPTSSVTPGRTITPPATDTSEPASRFVWLPIARRP